MSLLAKAHVPTSTPSSASATRILNTGSVLFVLFVSLVLFSTPLRQGHRMLAYAQDDLYYYLVVARNLAAGLGSTFDGTTQTNGYHPLYFLLLLGVVKVNDSLAFSYKALWLLDVASALTIFAAVRTLFARRLSNPLITNGFAIGIAALCAVRIVQQMEVTIALPIGLLFVLLLDRSPEELTPARLGGIGVVGALFILARLDAAILVLLILTAICTQAAYWRELNWRKIAAFSAAFLPLLLLYLAINHHYFHRFTPISGAAKQARTGIGLFRPSIHASFSRGAKIMFLFSLCGLCSMPVAWRRLSAQERVLCTSMLLFPFLHFIANLAVSDWMIFPWYRYSLIFSLTSVLILLCLAISRTVPVRAHAPVGVAVVLTSIVAMLTVRYVPDQMMSDIADAAFFIQDFTRTHPGRYAMGDRAGMVGYTDGVPTVQLEGLVMDENFLNHIRQREPLQQVLQTYDIDYYIGFDWRQPHNWPVPGCFHAREPNHAGPYSPVMAGDFCAPPVAEYMRPTGRTLIFDVHPVAGRSDTSDRTASVPGK